MASLKSLNIVALPKISSNPTLDRRARVTAKQLLSDSNYHRVVRSWSKNETGEKVPVESKQRIMPWWTVQPNGSYIFFRSGWKPIEFEKG